jgi:N-acetylneuraminic acid mutarotase
LFLLCGVLLARPCAAAPGEWDFTGRLNIARSYFTATLLPDGRALVVGGDDEAGNVEIYDRPTETWTFTGSLVIGRFGQTATLLPDGKVLVAGGERAGILAD